jgi:hypothetical protein
MHNAVLHPPGNEQRIATPFYQHPYGGIARDVLCSREGFARFFEHSVEYIDDLPFNTKVFDVLEPWTECLGYKIMSRRNGPMQYRITVIERGHSRVGKLFRIAPYLWDDGVKLLGAN